MTVGEWEEAQEVLPRTSVKRADCTKSAREIGMPQLPIERAVADATTWFGREGYL